MHTQLRALRALCLIAATCAVTACATARTEEPVKDASHQLSPRQSVALGPRLTLRYDSVEDSRCPPDVRCIWAGAVTYRFTLEGGARAGESFALSEAAPVFTSSAVKGLSIALGKFEVPPVSAHGAPPPAHPVTLDVRTR